MDISFSKLIARKLYSLIFLLLPTLIFAQTPAGTVIYSQASCSFRWGGRTFFTTSNVVLVEVAPVYAFEVTPDGTYSDPGQVRYSFTGNTVYFNYILYNRGNVSSSFSLRAENTNGSFNLIALNVYEDINSNGILEPGEDTPVHTIHNVPSGARVQLIVSGIIPNNTREGDSSYVNLIATSLGDTTQKDTDNIAIVHVVSGPAISAAKYVVPYGSVFPGDTLTYTIQFVNNGYSSADSVSVTEWFGINGNLIYTSFVSGSAQGTTGGRISYYSKSISAWINTEPQLPDDIGGVRFTMTNFGPGQSGYFQFKMMVNPEAPETTIFNTGIVEFYRAQDNRALVVNTNTTVNNVVVVPIIHLGPFGNSMALPGGERSRNDVQINDTVTPGNWAYFRNTIYNQGPGNAFVQMGLILDSLDLGEDPIIQITSYDFTSYYYDNNNDGFFDLGTIRAGDSLSIGVKVFIPSNVSDPYGYYHTLTLFAFPDTFVTARNYTYNKIHADTTRVRLYLHQTVYPDTVILSGKIVRFNIEFENRGRVPLTNFVVYDRVDTLLHDIRNRTPFYLPHFTDSTKQIPVYYTYNADTRVIEWRIDTLPVGFRGVLSFQGGALLDTSVTEGFIFNQASAISNENPAGDTSNSVYVHVIAPALSLSKTASTQSAEIGDVVRYTISVRNNMSDGFDLYPVYVIDTLPYGFRYINKSLKIQNGRVDSLFYDNRNNILEIILDTLRSKETAVITYDVLVGPGVKLEKYANTAYARSTILDSIPVLTDPVKAWVRIKEGFATYRGFIFGKVFLDKNDNRVQDPDEPGVPNIGIETNEGIYVTTDENGKYSIPYLKPQPHIVKIDQNTLPPNTKPAPISIDNLEDDAQLVYLPLSSHRKVNFRLIPSIQKESKYSDFTIRKTAIPIVANFRFSSSLPTSFFETAKATLNPGVDLSGFKWIAEFVKKYPDWKVLVEGHTDPRPIRTKEFPDNYVLSMARARTIANVLIDFGCPRENITIKGYGPSKPLIDNSTAYKMSINRRVDITLIPGKTLPVSDMIDMIIEMNINKDFSDEIYLFELIPEGTTVLLDSVKSNIPSFDAKIVDSFLVMHLAGLDSVRSVRIEYKLKVNEAEKDKKVTSTLIPVIKRSGRFTKLPEISIQPELATTATEMKINIPNKILFKENNYSIFEGAVLFLSHIVDLLNMWPDAKVEIAGYANSDENEPAELSRKRAEVVYNWLLKQGISEDRLSFGGYSASNPLFPEDSPLNKQLNRRVEITILRGQEGQSKKVEKAMHLRSNQLRVSMPFASYANYLQIDDTLSHGYYFVENSALIDTLKPDSVRTDGKTISFYFSKNKVKALKDTFTISYLTSREESLSVSPLDSTKMEAIEVPSVIPPAIIYPEDSLIITDGKSIRVKVASIYRIPVELYVNGVKIDDSRIGFHKIDPEHNLEIREYVGLKLKEGANIIRLKTVGTDNTVKEIIRTVFVPGAPSKINMRLANEAIADGYSKPMIEVLVFDENNIPAGDNIELTFETEGVEILSEDERPAIPGFQRILKNGRSEIILAPSMQSKKGKLTAYIPGGKDTARINVYYRPAVSNLSMLGGFDIKASYQNGSLSPDAFLSFYLKRPIITNNYILTTGLTYNTYMRDLLGEDENREMFEHMYSSIRVDELYPTFGDASRSERISSSRSGFFMRVEKGSSYIQYGDFKSNFGGYALARFYRALTGGIMRIDGGKYEINAFLAPDKQSLRKDEFKADGTVGYFTLSSAPITSNSEEVYVVTRDRYHPDMVIKKEKLSPHIDYSLNPNTGLLLLKYPIPSYDENLNPIYIVVLYEVNVNTGRTAYALDLSYKLGKESRIGFLHGHTSSGEGRFYTIDGLYTSLKYGNLLEFKGEGALSNSSGEKGFAFSSNLKLKPHNKFEIYASYDGRDSTFNTTGTLLGGGRKEENVQLGANYNPQQNLRFSSKLYIKDIAHSQKSTSIEALVQKDIRKNLMLGFGFKKTTENYEDTTRSSHMGVLLLNTKLYKTIDMKLKHEQVIDHGDIRLDPPRSSLNLSWAAFKYLSVNSTFEHRWGAFGGTTILLGLESAVSTNATFYSNYRYENVGNGTHNQNVSGVKSALPITKNMKALFNAEYVNDLSHDELDHISTTFGLEYNNKEKYMLSGLNTYTISNSSIRELIQLSGIVQKENGLGFVFNEKLYFEKNRLLTENNLKRIFDGYAGLVYRPTFNDKINAFLMLRHYYTDDKNYGNNRVVLYNDLSFQPVYPFILDMRYGVKKTIGNELTSATTHLLSLWMRYEIKKDKYYASLGNRILYQPLVKTMEKDWALEFGWVAMKNMVLGLGYNFHGIKDESFYEFEATKKGFYVHIGGKFNAEILKLNRFYGRF
ncbi:MAG: OmpA family protein [Candidatus Hydrothermia bacterium]